MNVFLTGVSRGIGYELLHYFLSNPENQVIGLSRDASKLEIIHAEVAAFGWADRFFPVCFDLGQVEQDWMASFFPILEKWASVDILVNNAGMLVNQSFALTPMDKAMSIFLTNFFGPARLIQILIPWMGKGPGRSHVVNIGSMGGFQGSSKYPGLAFYSASKAALANLTECLAAEFEGMNISFNALALGAVNTEMLASAFPGYQAPVQPKEMARFIGRFAETGQGLFQGKVIPVSFSNP